MPIVTNGSYSHPEEKSPSFKIVAHHRDPLTGAFETAVHPVERNSIPMHEFGALLPLPKLIQREPAAEIKASAPRGPYESLR